MAVSEELIAFVKDGLSQGIPRARIEEALLRAGWPQAQVKAALVSFADVDFPIPVPRPRPYTSAREAFLYVVMFTTLYVSAYNLGSLVFEFINRLFPDPAAPPSELSALLAIRWSVSSLIVAFPVFLYVAWLIDRGIRQDPTRRGSNVRRQLTYLTLFVASSALLGDVTTLIYNFLGGELTVRFVLKAVTVGVIAGTAFWYYLSDLRTEEKALEA